MGALAPRDAGADSQKRGGGKPCGERLPPLEENFLRVRREYPAGDPRPDNVRWTNLTLKEIAERVAAAGTPVSVTVVKHLLRTPH